MGDADPTNVSQRSREGWIPVPPEDQPELAALSEVEGQIAMGGLILMQTDRENMEARDEYHAEQNRRQLESVDGNYMRESDPRMPVLPTEHRSRVSFGGGS